MKELKEEKEEKESILSSLNKELKEVSSRVNEFRSKGSLIASGLNEESVVSEQERGESLMRELCCIRVRIDDE